MEVFYTLYINKYLTLIFFKGRMGKTKVLLQQKAWVRLWSGLFGMLRNLGHILEESIRKDHNKEEYDCICRLENKQVTAGTLLAEWRTEMM